MTRPTEAQQRQRSLAWLILTAEGARGTLAKIQYADDKYLSEATAARIKTAVRNLSELIGAARQQMLFDKQYNEALRAARPSSTKRTLHDNSQQLRLSGSSDIPNGISSDE